MWVSISVFLRMVLDDQACFYIARSVQDALLKNKPVPQEVLRADPEIVGVRLFRRRLWLSRLDLRRNAGVEDLFAFDLVPRFPILKPLRRLALLSIGEEETGSFRIDKVGFRITVCNLRLDLEDPVGATMASQIAGWKIQRGKNHTHIGALMLNHIWFTERGIRFILTIPIAPWVTAEKTVVGEVASVQAYPALTEKLIRAIDGQNRSPATVHLQI